MKRFIMRIDNVPGRVAILLSTSSLLPELDLKTSTRIMGIGFKSPEYPLSFPFNPDIGSQTGSFFYIADIDGSCDPSKSIWNVLSILLADDQKTLDDIKNANHGRDLRVAAPNPPARNPPAPNPPAPDPPAPNPPAPNPPAPNPPNTGPKKGSIAFMLGSNAR